MQYSPFFAVGLASTGRQALSAGQSSAENMAKDDDSLSIVSAATSELESLIEDGIITDYRYSSDAAIWSPKEQAMNAGAPNSASASVSSPDTVPKRDNDNALKEPCVGIRPSCE